MGLTSDTVTGSCQILSYTQGGALEDSQTQSRPYNSYTSFKPDRVRTLKPSGWLYPKAYSTSLVSFTYPLGTLSSFYTTGELKQVQSGVLTQAWNNDPETMDHISLDGVEDRMIIKALTKLKDTKVNLGVALGEARSTAKTLQGGGIDRIQQVANTVGRRLSQVARAGRAAKKGRWKEAERHLGAKRPRGLAAPRTWLELQYGWSPLLSDIYGATTALSEEAPHIMEGFTKTVKANYRERDDRISLQQLYPHGVSELTRKAEAGVSLRLDYEPSNTFLQAVTNVGLTNPLEVAWELVPFSFVVDWALPIGNWLHVLDADLGWRFRSGSCTHFQKTLVTARRVADNYAFIRGDWEGGKLSKLNMDRKVYADSPLPSFPSLKNPFSVGHLANGLSLLTAIWASAK